MSFGNGNKIAQLEKQIEHLKTTNGALCMEINRQERVIEEQRAQITRLVAANDARAERIRELESLVLDMYSVLNVHEKAYRDDFGFTASKHFESRMAELGLEVADD